MKNNIVIIVMLSVISGCVSEQAKYYPCGQHACQYVKDHSSLFAGVINKVEVVGEDTLLGDIILSFEQGNFAKANMDFLNGEISNLEFKKIVDNRANVLKDIQNSWEFGNVVNDSLRKLEKYDDVWRRVYNVRLTMKDGEVKDRRVLMDSDGETARMLEWEFGNTLDDYNRDILQAYEYLRTK